MNLNELADTVSAKGLVDKRAVRSALQSVIDSIREEVIARERTVIPGLGMFVKRTLKENGETRILFKLLPAKGERPAKAAAEKKGKAGGGKA